MNQTETKAHAWLQAQGKGDLRFQPRRSPDFVAPDGRGYEVKLVREGAIVFTAAQVEAIKGSGLEVDVLIYDGGSPQPAHVVAFSELSIPGRWGPYRLITVDMSRYGSPLTIRLPAALLVELKHRHAETFDTHGMNFNTWMISRIQLSFTVADT